jgi:hypothetical protein
MEIEDFIGLLREAKIPKVTLIWEENEEKNMNPNTQQKPTNLRNIIFSRQQSSLILRLEAFLIAFL